MTIIALYQRFLEERQYLKNVSPKTLECYRQCWKAIAPVMPEHLDALTLDAIKLIPIYLRQTPTRHRGARTPEGTNICIRVMNAFLKWLTTEHQHPPLRLSLLKCEKRVLPVYTAEHILTIMNYRPNGTNLARVRALWLLLMDTGCRINEARLLTRDKINLDNCTIRVMGKGSKERIVPFGNETRKILYSHLRTHTHSFVFSTRTGQPISARNAARDLTTLLARLKLPLVKRMWHSTRRTFGTTYIRNGGDVFRLQQTLGHSNLETTRRYVEIDLEALQSVHSGLSPLAVIKR